ncbi:MAG: hydroxyphenylacetyl-CoA thioesterase PaaI [Saprospiraceae bacterium]|nr:hydroxyphenylacetyl-CoA thioesterase PaaI [Saprospiraceae bacterium]
MTLTPREIVDKMFAKDDFSQWLGITFLEVSPGYCKIKMAVREEMTNGFDIAHGGISFSFADSAFAFASNSRGKHAVSIETSISHTRAIKAGDILIAEATETNVSNKLGHYDVEVVNQNKKIVAIFKGTVFRKDVEWV